ncbi:MAG: ATP-binding protein, partial [Saprospiraceae bacterium]
MHFKYTSLLLSIFCWLFIYTINRYQDSSFLVNNTIEKVQNKLNSDNKKALGIIQSGKDLSTKGDALQSLKIKYFVSNKDSLIYWNDIDGTFDFRDKEQFVSVNHQLYYLNTYKDSIFQHAYLMPVQGVTNDENKIVAPEQTLLSPGKNKTHFVHIDYSLEWGYQWLVLVAYLMGLFWGIRFIKTESERLIRKKYVLGSLLVFTVGVFGLRLFSLRCVRPIEFTNISFLQSHVHPSLLSPTLLDLMVNIGILCLMVWFVRSYIRPHYFNRNRNQNYFIAVLNYFLVYVSSIVMVLIFRQLVIGSGISFDFEYIFYLDIKSFIALAGILTLAISLFIFDLHLLRIIKHLGLSSQHRLIANGIALLVLLSVLFVLPIRFPFVIILGLVGYLILLDISTDYFKPQTAWYLVWTLTGSILISSILYQFHTDKELDQRISITETLNAALSKQSLNSAPEIEKFLVKKLAEIESNSSYLAIYSLKNTTLKNAFINQNALIPAKKDQAFYLSKKSNPVFKIFSFFSYIFILFNLLLLSFNFLNNRFKWFAFSIFKIFPATQTLRYRIQTSMLIMSVTSFLLIAVVIIMYVKKNASAWQLNDSRISIEQIDDWKKGSPLALINEETLVYDHEGWQLPSKEKRMPYADWAAIHFGDDPTGIKKINFENQVFYLKSNTENSSIHTKRRLNDFLGALLNVYVFLLIGIVILSMLVSNSIAKPLTILSTKLKEIQVGGSNQRLEWNHQDELGGLIRNYNQMIQELDRSTRMLALTERETAWREMAKQVAHEIKNPLTPMKLITQHLQNSISRAEPEDIPALVKRVTQTLIEQIENLSKIASEFSNFAKLPAPENEKIVLNEVVTSTHDLFRKREDMDIHLRVPIDEIYVFADKNHIIRVLTNIIKNAIQAIPLGRRGRIEILLYKVHEKAIIKVIDNGCGIPEAMRDKVFYPNFTTKNSGTGLGLAIVRDIIDSCNGHIYFHTEENKGTEFFIELPLMHMKDNFIEEE